MTEDEGFQDVFELRGLNRDLRAQVLELCEALEVAKRSARQWESEAEMAARNNADRVAEVAELRKKLKDANKRAGDAAAILGWNRVATDVAGAEVVRLRAVVTHLEYLSGLRSDLLHGEG